GGGLSYLFDATGAVLRTFTNPGSFGGFGTSVAVVGGNVLIGVKDDGPGGGAAYLFDGTTGALLLTIPDPSPAAERLFGSVVAAFGNDILVSAPTYTGPGEVDLFDGTTGALLQTFANPNPGYVDLFHDAFGGAIAGVGGHVVVGAPGEDSSGP